MLPCFPTATVHWPPLPDATDATWPTSHDDLELSDTAWRHFEPLLATHGYELIWGISANEPPRDAASQKRTDADHFPPAQNPFCPLPHESFNYALRGRTDTVWTGFFFQPIVKSAHDRYNRIVILKAVRSASNELSILKQLAFPPLRQDPRNHTIPVIDVIATSAGWCFLVMPPWDCHPVDIPPCTHVYEYLVTAEQLLEGLAFMHTHSIAHLDIINDNVLLNHYQDTWEVRTHNPQPFLSCFDARFAYIDFGFSVRAPLGARVPEAAAPGSYHIVPEIGHLDWRRGDPRDLLRRPDANFDPFAADVWMLGRLLREQFEAHERWTPWIDTGTYAPHAQRELRRVLPEYPALYERMQALAPEERPSAAQALEDVRAMRSLLAARRPTSPNGSAAHC